MLYWTAVLHIQQSTTPENGESFEITGRWLSGKQ